MSRQPPARRRRTRACAAGGSARGRPTGERSWIGSAGDCVDEQVHTHAERRLVELGRILVHLRILPAVAEVTRVAVVHGEAVSEEYAESTRGFPVVFVNL